MASIEDFVESPNEDVLGTYKKDQLLRVADHYGLELPKKLNKEELLVEIKAQLVEKSILSVFLGPTSKQSIESGNVSGVAPVLSGLGVGLSFKEQKELLMLHLERDVEIEKLRQNARLQEAEIAQVQVRQKLDLERYRLELMSEGKLPAETRRAAETANQAFDIAVNLRIVPRFNEKDPDIFFVLFERLAEARDWSDVERTLLLQCVFTGKAQEAFAAMTAEDSSNYQLVKAAVLQAFELVPEAYRQRFRLLRKEKQSHMEFARDLTTSFNRWCVSSQVKTLEDLQELILLEQFKGTLPDRVVTYINEQKVNLVSEAAKLADEFTLTHKVFFGDSRSRGDAGYKESSAGAHFSKGVSEGKDKFPARIDHGNRGKFDPNRVCNYCFNKGHWRNDCPEWKRKSRPGPVSAKASGAVASLRAVERESAIAAVRKHTRSSLSESVIQALVSEHEEIDPGYKAFVSDGFVSLVGRKEKVPVKILRDSGALDSFIVGSVLPFSPKTDTGSSVEVRGMGLTVFSAPQHKLTLVSSLLQGEVVMGVRPSLPMGGIQIILGNDLAGDRVWPESPISQVEGAKFPKTTSVMPASGAVTRAASRIVCDLTKDKKKQSVFPVPTFPLPLSCSDLGKEQKNDPTLQALYSQVLPDEEFRSAARGYFLQDGLLEMSLLKDVRALQVIPGELLKPFKSNFPSRLAQSRAELLEKLLAELGTENSGFTLDNVMMFCTAALEHNASAVRELAVRIILSMYQQHRAAVLCFLPPNSAAAQKNFLFKILFEGFAKIDGKLVETQTLKKGGGQQDGQKEKEEIHSLQEQLAALKEITERREESTKEEIPDEEAPKVESKKAVKTKSDSIDVQQSINYLDNLCIFCGKKDESFTEDGLDLHYWKHCPMLRRCDECRQVVEIASLTEHLLGECESRSRFSQCPRCSEAVAPEDLTRHVQGPACNAPISGKGSNHCPLCHNNFIPGEKAWKAHLMGREGCKQNSRRTAVSQRTQPAQGRAGGGAKMKHAWSVGARGRAMGRGSRIPALAPMARGSTPGKH
ncbi:uncharacterized protein cep104 isoform X1 [Pseudochaenichthys georgianus]|uniref:uncharacterized protein cep104 isoform X1 n=1 Tax=Pseudochaenichthys georgianus TaxID=52239 RepID=UPI00146C9904|nr:uncharacterized protein cep104 isoform X1 [Pseudochaenichthys georgianus]XP_033942525.1 uncharacterized protein cep104 isoform X1 [Pseudochaenichthys georgianus]